MEYACWGTSEEASRTALAWGMHYWHPVVGFWCLGFLSSWRQGEPEPQFVHAGNCTGNAKKDDTGTVGRDNKATEVCHEPTSRTRNVHWKIQNQLRTGEVLILIQQQCAAV